MKREIIGYLLCSVMAIAIMGVAVYILLLLFYPPHEAIRYVQFAVAVITGIVAYFGVTAWQKRTGKQ